MSVVCAAKYRNENLFYHLVIALVSLIISFFYPFSDPAAYKFCIFYKSCKSTQKMSVMF